MVALVQNSGKFEVVKVDATVKRGKDYAQDEDTTVFKLLTIKYTSTDYILLQIAKMVLPSLLWAGTKVFIGIDRKSCRGFRSSVMANLSEL